MINNRFKFRVWDKPISEMSYDVCIGFVKDGATRDWVCADTSCGQVDYLGKRLKDIEVMQCTGLKDKNGKLIYEGDILKLSEFGKPVEVKFKAIGFVLRREPSNTPGYENDKYIPEDCEVIGNIYENPELLQECE